MSFSPIPAELESDLINSRLPLLELGSGDGRFTRVLQALNPGVMTLDLSVRERPDIVADVRRLPLRNDTCRGLLAANLLRHVIGTEPNFEMLEAWLDCLTAGGLLWILEDEPHAENQAERNYLDLQEFLGVVFPSRRGPLLAQDRLLRYLGGRAVRDVVSHGRLHNEYRLESVEKVYIMLERLAGAYPDESARLTDKIRRHGLSYGSYWWVRLKRSGL